MMNPRIETLLKTCKKHAPTCIFRIYDSEAPVIKTGDIKKALDAIDGGDDFAGIDVYENKELLGEFYCQPYGDEDEVIYDHTANEFCERVFDEVQNYYAFCEKAEILKNN